MSRTQAIEEYTKALRLGQKELKQRQAQGLSPYPEVLDDLVGAEEVAATLDLGLVEVPVERIVGVKSAGRIAAFAVGFLPILPADSEFGSKWIKLCESHLESGIREPVHLYEYLGNFYVQEGNKRVSVLRCMGAVSVTAAVKRMVPKRTETPRIRAYYEFLDFYRDSKLYEIQFRHPGDYAQLLAHLGRTGGKPWTEQERRSFRSAYGYFLEAFRQTAAGKCTLLPEEALLSWLEVYPFQDLGRCTDRELNKTILAVMPDLAAQSSQEPVAVVTEPPEQKTAGVLSKILPIFTEKLKIAFLYPWDAVESTWVRGHDLGRQQLEAALGDQITVKSYFHADDEEKAAQLLEQAVEDGANVIFTTTPQLRRQTLKAAVKYPDRKFWNCSVDTPFASIRTYYCRIYEGKFITGAIAGAMAHNDRIGYIATAPILGVPASINAFALGAQMTNPWAEIDLRWSCVPGAPQADFLREGIRVISNRDVPTAQPMYLGFCNYGTYALDEKGKWLSLGSPVWMWGNVYITLVKSMLSGALDKEKSDVRAQNYWLGFRGGAIDVELSDSLPPGVRALAETLREGLRQGTLDPFGRRILDQKGQERNDGSQKFSPEEILRMDWLCENVRGSIPAYEELLPAVKPMVRQLGIYRDRLTEEGQ